MHQKMHPLPVEAVLHPKVYSNNLQEYLSELVVKAMSGTFGQPEIGGICLPAAVVYLHNANSYTEMRHGGKRRSVIVPHNLDHKYLGNPWARTLEESHDPDEAL